jgi:hypothetical protein
MLVATSTPNSRCVPAVAHAGYAVEQAVACSEGHQQPGAASQHAHSQGQHQQQQQLVATAASTVMAGLRPVLLDTDPALQLLGVQLLAAVTARAPAVLLLQLMAADACEHVFEVLRGTLASCSVRARILGSGTVLVLGGASSQQQQQQALAGTLGATAEALQVSCVCALRHLATQGACWARVHGPWPRHGSRRAAAQQQLKHLTVLCACNLRLQAPRSWSTCTLAWTR